MSPKKNSESIIHAPRNDFPVLILLSGGIDSTASISYYLEKEYSVTTLFVDYGQLSAKHEYESVKKVTKYYEVRNQLIEVSGNKNFKDGFILGRNSFLLNVALMNFNKHSGMISLGIHSGTSYIDCSQEFINQMQKSFDLYKDGQIQIDAPFINLNKQEILEFCKINKVPLELTYSCELGLSQPCGKCLSCKDLEVFYVGKKKHSQASV